MMQNPAAPNGLFPSGQQLPSQTVGNAKGQAALQITSSLTAIKPCQSSFAASQPEVTTAASSQSDADSLCKGSANNELQTQRVGHNSHSVQESSHHASPDRQQVIDVQHEGHCTSSSQSAVKEGQAPSLTAQNVPSQSATPVVQARLAPQPCLQDTNDDVQQGNEEASVNSLHETLQASRLQHDMTGSVRCCINAEPSCATPQNSFGPSPDQCASQSRQVSTADSAVEQQMQSAAAEAEMDDAAEGQQLSFATMQRASFDSSSSAAYMQSSDQQQSDLYSDCSPSEDSNKPSSQRHEVESYSISQQQSCSVSDTLHTPCLTLHANGSCSNIDDLSSDTQQHVQHGGWYTGRALSEASTAASDDEEGTPTPSGRDSMLEMPLPLCQLFVSCDAMRDNVQTDGSEDDLCADMGNNADGYPGCSNDYESESMWSCPQRWQQQQQLQALNKPSIKVPHSR